jgi:hypothetical protein
MRGIEHGRYAIEEGGVLNLLDLSELRGMHQEIRSAGEQNDGGLVATRAELNILSADIWR